VCDDGFPRQMLSVRTSVPISKSEMKKLACEIQLQLLLYAPHLFILDSSILLLLRFNPCYSLANSCWHAMKSMICSRRCTGMTISLLCIKRPRRCRHVLLDHNANVHAVPHRLDKIPCLVFVAVIPSVLVYKFGFFKHVVVQDADICVKYSVSHSILVDR
jgi:hypothetical protein